MREGHTVHLLIERLLDNLWSTLIQHAAHLNTSMNLALPSTVFADAVMKTFLIRRLTIHRDLKHREATVVMIIDLSHNLASF